MADDSDDDFDFDELRAKWQAARKKEFDFDEWAKEVENHPAFIQTMPEGDQLSEAAAALQALKYDEDDDLEVQAKSYKDDGNKNFELKKYRWALDSYTQGIKLKCPDAKLNAVLYANRAACHFRLENYRSALKDCVLARRFDATHLKATVRGIECLLKLSQPVEALTWIREVERLRVDGDSSSRNRNQGRDLKQLEAEASKMMKVMARDERKARKAAETDRSNKLSLMNAFKARRLRFRDSIQLNDPDKFVWSKIEVNLPGEERVIRVSFDDADPDVLVWPVLFLYPEFGQTDFIRAFREVDTFLDHVSLMLSSPAPWDREQEYTIDFIKIYFESWDEPGTLFEVPSSVTLASVLTHPKYAIANGCPSFVLYSSTSSSSREHLAKYTLSSL